MTSGTTSASTSGPTAGQTAGQTAGHAAGHAAVAAEHTTTQTTGHTTTQTAAQTVRCDGLPAGRRAFTWKRTMFELVRAAGLIALLNLFVVQISVVRGHSMEPSLYDSDRLVVDRLCYTVGEVQRFDVVVLRYPREPDVDFVKRVVGLPGDRIRICHGLLEVNGKFIDQQFAFADGADMPLRIVPDGCYFVLGDNRGISCDSREFGFVEEEMLKGKVRLRFWPLDRACVF